MTENEIAKIVIEIAFKLHRELGSGLLESVYERLIFHELVKCDLNTEKQLLTYLRLAEMKLGLLLNFGAPLMKNGIVRIANNL